MHSPQMLLATLLLCFAFSLCVCSRDNIFDSPDLIDKTDTAKKAGRKLRSGDVEGALKILDKAIEERRDLLEAYRTRSYAREVYGYDIDGAISDLDKALEIKPENAYLLWKRAHLKRRYKSDFQGALLDYQTAQKYSSKSLTLHKQIANMKMELKDFDGAIAEMQSAIAILPEAIDFHIDMSVFLTLKEGPDKGIAHLQTFIDGYLRKRNGRLPKIVGERVRRNKASDGQKDYPNAKNPLSIIRHTQMNVDAFSWNDLQRQLSEMEEARELAKAFVQLGRMHTAKNDYEKALANLKTALDIDKNHEAAYGLRGVIYLSKGEYEKAIAELSDAIDITDEPYFFLNRGIAYLSFGNDKKAKSDFDYFLKIYPEGKMILDERVAETKQNIQKRQGQPK
jgi:tetratricopeptide (TPR) repeat protein